MFSLSDELGLVSKLRSLNVVCRAFEGLTTIDQRRDIVRRAVVHNQVEGVVYTVSAGKQVSIAQQFAKAYGEALA